MRAAVLLALAAALQDDPAEDLVRKLGSESIDERATAARTLSELGEAARPALQRATKSSDIETSRRASVLLRVLDLRGRLSPAIREQFPNVEERLSNGADSEWTSVFLQAGRSGLPTADLVVLAPAAFRGARTPEETTSVCDVVRSRAIRSALPDMLKLLQRPEQGIARQAARCVTALDGPELRRGLLAILEGKGPPASRATERSTPPGSNRRSGGSWPPIWGSRPNGSQGRPGRSRSSAAASASTPWRPLSSSRRSSASSRSRRSTRR